MLKGNPLEEPFTLLKCFIGVSATLYPVKWNRNVSSKLINELSKGPDLYIALGFLALSLIYGIYSVKSHTFKKLNEGNGKNKIIRALKMGLQATIIAFFGRLGLWIAPFFFVTFIELLV